MKSKRNSDEGSGDEVSCRSKKKSRSGRKRYSSEEYSSPGSEDEHQKRSQRDKRKRNKKNQVEEDIADDGTGSNSFKEKEIVRKELGLEWMLRPAKRTDRKPVVTVDNQPEEPPAEEMQR